MHSEGVFLALVGPLVRMDCPRADLKSLDGLVGGELGRLHLEVRSSVSPLLVEIEDLRKDLRLLHHCYCCRTG